MSWTLVWYTHCLNFVSEVVTVTGGLRVGAGIAVVPVRLLLLQADYVLVLVSPLYHRAVSGKARRDDGGGNVLHARHIHDRMYSEHLSNVTTTRRFVPIVMPGATTSDVPEWLRKSSQPFTWPQQYKNLMFYLIQPARVIANYVSRRDHAVPWGRANYVLSGTLNSTNSTQLCHEVEISLPFEERNDLLCVESSGMLNSSNSTEDRPIVPHINHNTAVNVLYYQ